MSYQSRPRKQCKHNKDIDEELFTQDLNLMQSITMLLTLVFFHTIALMGVTKDSNTHRVRKDLEKDIFLPLGETYFRQSYRMHKESFYTLHNLLSLELKKHFFPKNGGKRCIDTNPYLIKTETRLSIALRFFAGASPYNLMITHGVSYRSVYISVWGAVDVINKTPELKITFPTKKEQYSIVKGFEKCQVQVSIE